MRLAPFGLGYSLYRGNLHGHSTHSDGLLCPQAVVNKYIELGYDFTCLSDHLWIDDQFAATSIFDGHALNRNGFITLRSAELHCFGKKYDQDRLWHIVANGLPVDFACPDAQETAPDLIARAQAAGAYVSVAHPEWYNMTMDEAMTVAAADAVEIYNHSCVLSSAREGVPGPRGGSSLSVCGCGCLVRRVSHRDVRHGRLLQSSTERRQNTACQSARRPTRRN